MYFLYGGRLLTVAEELGDEVKMKGENEKKERKKLGREERKREKE